LYKPALVAIVVHLFWQTLEQRVDAYIMPSVQVVSVFVLHSRSFQINVPLGRVLPIFLRTDMLAMNIWYATMVAH
jgi:hypothetical protein